MKELKHDIYAMWEAVNELENIAMHPKSKKRLSDETLVIAITAIHEKAEHIRCKNAVGRRAKPENISEKEQAIIQQAMKEIKTYHCGDDDCLLPESKINDEGYWADDEACNACTYGACYRALKRSLIQKKIRIKEE